MQKEVLRKAFGLLNDLAVLPLRVLTLTWAAHIHQRWRDSAKQGVSIPYREQDEEELRKGYASFNTLVKKIDKQVSQLKKSIRRKMQ